LASNFSAPYSRNNSVKVDACRQLGYYAPSHVHGENKFKNINPRYYIKIPFEPQRWMIKNSLLVFFLIFFFGFFCLFFFLWGWSWFNHIFCLIHKD